MFGGRNIIINCAVIDFRGLDGVVGTPLSEKWECWGENWRCLGEFMVGMNWTGRKGDGNDTYDGRTA